MTEQVNPEYLAEYVACWPHSERCVFCNGYCGPSFGQHVCATCHAFLFPEPASCRDLPSHCGAGVITEKPDDSDSGNDEPADPFLTGSGSSSASTPAGADPPLPPSSSAITPSASATVGEASNGEVACSEDTAAERAVWSQDPLRRRLQLLSQPQPDPSCFQSSGCVDVQLLPCEVLMCIFEFVDDLTAWAMGGVCGRWRRLLMSLIDERRWRVLTLQRFPLFSADYPVLCWSYVYSKLVESACCWQCLYESCPLQRPPPDDDRSLRRKRLLHERKLLRSDPPDGIRAAPLDATLSRWQATITGPQDSAYEHGLFFLVLQIPENYPLRPPTVRFLTRILHPNVSRHGDIGVDSVQHNWTLALSIEKVLISIQSLLTDPFCGACMEPQLGRLCETDRPRFLRLARAWCRRYATTNRQPCVSARGWPATNTDCHLQPLTGDSGATPRPNTELDQSSLLDADDSASGLVNGSCV